MKRNDSLGNLTKKLSAFLMALALICGVCFGLPNAALNAKAENGDISAVRIHSWDNSAYMEYTAEITAGKTYTLSFLWLSTKDHDNQFQIDGLKLTTNNTPENGAEAEIPGGRYTYTFTANADTVTLKAIGENYAQEREFYFADVKLTETDENGNPAEGGEVIDCSADSFAKWSIINPYNYNVYPTTVKSNFFELPYYGLETLDVGYDLHPFFNREVLNYSVDVPYSVQSLDIKYTLGKNVTFKEILGNEGFEVGVPKDVAISVENADGEIVTYTLTVTRQEEVRDDQIKVVRLHEWNHDVGVNHRVTLEAGKTYKFTALWRSVLGTTPAVKLIGGAMGGNTVDLVINNEAKNGASYNKTTGLLTYEFTAQGTDLEILATMGEAKTEKDCYFAQPALFEVDANGEKVEDSDVDCDPNFTTSWAYWGYGGDYRHVMTADNDFFMVYGDANGDGVFNIRDLIRLKKSAAGYDDMVVFEAIGKTAGQTVDSEDLALARRGLLTDNGNIFKKASAAEQSGEWQDPDTGDNGAADIF